MSRKQSCNQADAEQQSAKRKRNPNLQPGEKNLLLELLAQNYSIIENKRTDAVCSRDKTEKWRSIATEFNSSSSVCERSPDVLKGSWENMKKNARHRMSLQSRRSFERTGGGKPVLVKDDPFLDRVIELIKPNIQGFHNNFDSDVAYLPVLPDIDVVHEEVVVEEIEEDGINDKVDDSPIIDDVVNPEESLESQDLLNGSWDHYNPSKMRQPKSQVLRSHSEKAEKENPLPVASENTISQKSTRHLTSRRRPILNKAKADLLAEAKIKALTLTTDQATEQHNVTIRILRLQEQQEEEKLTQERIKTQILQEELQKINNGNF